MDLRAFEDVIEELVTGYQSGSNYWITVTNVTTPHNFYIRSTNYDDHLELLESQIIAKGKIEPNIHDIVVYRAQGRGGKIMRARVIGFDKTELSTTYQLFALDYGYIDEEVEFEDIFLCDNAMLEVPPLALQCQLHQCAPVGTEWSEDSIEAFKYYLGEECCKMIVKHNIQNKLIIELFNSCPDDLGTMLALTGYSTLGYVDPFASRVYSGPTITRTQNIERTRKYYFKYKERQVDKTYHVRMLYYKNLEEFYVAEVGEYRKYKKLLKEFTEKVSKEREIREEELVVGRPVLVKAEKQRGYRGIIERVLPAAEASICLIDCGKRILVEKTNIRSIPRSLLDHPVTAIYCRTEELDIGITVSSLKQPGFKFNMKFEVSGSELKIPNTVKITRV